MKPGAVALMLLFAAAPLAAQPRTMGLMYYDSTRACPGYTLVAPQYYHVVYMIDNQGRQVHSWNTTSPPKLSSYFLEDGSLLHPGQTIEVRSWDNVVTWSYALHGDSWGRTHDVCMLPNGHVLSVCWENKSVAAALAAGRNPARLNSGGLVPDLIIEVDTTTNRIVWEWHSWDHLVQDYDSTKANYGVVRSHPELIDVNYGIGEGGDTADFMHFNSVAYNPDLDQIVVSPRIYSEVWVVDHSTTTAEARGHTGGRHGRGGDLLYRWGNPATYGRGDTLRHRLYFQHSPCWIEDGLPGAGNMLAFSNGCSRRRWSDVEEWIPQADSLGSYSLRPDSTYGPDCPVWWYRDSTWVYSSHEGGAQRLPNGNTLVDDALHGTFFEVTPDTHLVWEYISPVDSAGPMHQGDSLWQGLNTVFRCYRYAPDYPGFAGRSLVPGDPIELPAVTSVAEPASAVRAGDVRLAVVPSAVRGRATVVLSLPSPLEGHLAVYDSRGAQVAVLADGRLTAGEHRLAWDGTAAAGVYFCRLRAGAATASAKVLRVE